MTYIIIYYNFVELFLKNLKCFDMRKFYFFLITFLALGISLNAQEIKVSGIVTSAEDGWGLPGVTIQVKDNRFIGNCNARSSFHICEQSQCSTIVPIANGRREISVFSVAHFGNNILRFQRTATSYHQEAEYE